MVAALEMALNNGRHPLMNWKVGPETGEHRGGRLRRPSRNSSTPSPRSSSSSSTTPSSTTTMLGKAHGLLRPTPLLSSLIDGPIGKGMDVTKGGATLQQLRRGLHRPGRHHRFAHGGQEARVRREAGHLRRNSRRPSTPISKATRALHAMVMNKVPLFGSGSDEALAMAQRVATFAHDAYGAAPKLPRRPLHRRVSGPCPTT